MKNTRGEMRITEIELGLLKATFADNDVLLKVLRKIFFPEVTADAPIGQNLDLWMTLKIEDMSPEDALINLKARNTVIQHVEQCLMQIKALAGLKDDTVEQTVERLKTDSNK